MSQMQQKYNLSVTEEAGFVVDVSITSFYFFIYTFDHLCLCWGPNIGINVKQKADKS